MLKAEKRELKRHKKKHGMKVDGRAIKVFMNNEEFKYKEKHQKDKQE